MEYIPAGKAVRDGKIVTEQSVTPEPAFEGAEGGGKYTRGGRGGEVYVVTSLEDTGEEGTLRHAVEAEGPRIVEFAVEGDIHLKSTLKIENPYITISGETAPGKGITLRDHGMYIGADEVIVRYMRFRMGSASKDENDALGARHVKNLIIDHCSMSWATDENASFYAISDASIQWCIIAEALNSSIHRKGEHGYGGIWGGRNVSFHHNIIADNNSRNPRFDHPAIYSGSDRRRLQLGHESHLRRRGRLVQRRIEPLHPGPCDQKPERALSRSLHFRDYVHDSGVLLYKGQYLRHVPCR